MKKVKLTEKQLKDGFIRKCTECEKVYDKDEIICEDCYGRDT